MLPIFTSVSVSLPPIPSPSLSFPCYPLPPSSIHPSGLQRGLRPPAGLDVLTARAAYIHLCVRLSPSYPLPLTLFPLLSPPSLLHPSLWPSERPPPSCRP